MNFRFLKKKKWCVFIIGVSHYSALSPGSKRTNVATMLTVEHLITLSKQGSTSEYEAFIFSEKTVDSTLWD